MPTQTPNILFLCSIDLMADVSQSNKLLAEHGIVRFRTTWNAGMKGNWVNPKPTKDAHEQAVLERPRLQLRPAEHARCRQRKPHQQHHQGCCCASRRPPCSYVQQRLPGQVPTNASASFLLQCASSALPMQCLTPSAGRRPALRLAYRFQEGALCSAQGPCVDCRQSVASQGCRQEHGAIYTTPATNLRAGSLCPCAALAAIKTSGCLRASPGVREPMQCQMQRQVRACWAARCG